MGGSPTAMTCCKAGRVIPRVYRHPMRASPVLAQHAQQQRRSIGPPQQGPGTSTGAVEAQQYHRNGKAVPSCHLSTAGGSSSVYLLKRNYYTTSLVLI